MLSFNWSVSFNVGVLLVSVRVLSDGCVYVLGLWCPRIPVCGGVVVGTGAHGDGGLMRYIPDSGGVR